MAWEQANLYRTQNYLDAGNNLLWIPKTSGMIGVAGSNGVRIGCEIEVQPNLLDELAARGAKYNLDDIVMISKTPDGKLLWLENGNTSSGLKHIIDGHFTDFAARGVDNIPSFLKDVLHTTPIKTDIGAKGPFSDYLVNGNKYRVAYGTNGYVVTFYPLS